MASNIEIKARANDIEAQEQIAQQLSDQDRLLLEQEDIFFVVPNGRLKLRILSPDQGELIYYQRADQAGPRPSNYLISRTDDPSTLKTILTSTMEVFGTVRKVRHLYLVGQTRIHLDRVEGLGEFIELEYVLHPGEDPAEGHQVVKELSNQLGIHPGDMISHAYIDLLHEQEAHSNFQSERPWVRYWGRHGEGYDEYMRFTVGDEVLRQMRASISQEEPLGHVLELGCGSGFFTRFIAEKAEQVTATDLSLPLLTIAQRKYRRHDHIDFAQIDAEQIEYPDASFDTVFMSNLITIVNPYKTLSECWRVLKPGGVLLITNLVTRRMTWSDRINLIARTVMKFGIPPLGRKDYSPEKLATLVARNGFSVHKARLVGDRIKFVYLRAKKT